MVVYENISSKLIRAYSDAGYMIHGGDPEADYPEAVDPIDAHRTYTETDIPVPEPEEPDDLNEDSLY